MVYIATMPHFMRFRFPGTVEDDGHPSPERRARAMAAVFLAIPLADLTVGRVESAAIMLTDRGVLEWATGDPMGERLAPWLHLVVTFGGRRAYLDCDPEAMGRMSVNESPQTKRHQ